VKGWTVFQDSPVGKLSIVANESALLEVTFVEDLVNLQSFVAHSNEPPGSECRSTSDEPPTAVRRILDEVQSQLNEYFEGQRQQFRFHYAAIRPQGTSFQQRVWKELMSIPYGATISYGELARRIGQPTASRAVGLANGRNPISIIIPCHRVIGSNGRLVGYGGGLDRKKRLLDLEAAAAIA
jgi:methylated-DNA-[protein]-cysteine S-methyltransferase